MATPSAYRVSRRETNHRRTRSKPLARAILFAILGTQISSVAAWPLPSLPASAPGFNAAAVPALHEAISIPAVDPVTPSTDPDLTEDEADGAGYWESEYDELANADDEIMGVDSLGNAIEKGIKSTISSNSPPPSQPPQLGPLTLPESLLAALSRILHLGFWQGLLGSFLVFWVLIAGTVGALVVVGVRVRRMERSGRLEALALEMGKGRGRKEVEVEDVGEGGEAGRRMGMGMRRGSGREDADADGRRCA